MNDEMRGYDVDSERGDYGKSGGVGMLLVLVDLGIGMELVLKNLGVGMVLVLMGLGMGMRLVTCKMI